MKRCLAAAAVAAAAMGAGAAEAQNRTLASDDWSSSWGFSSTSQENLRLLQADLIKKAEEGYYDSLGPAPIHITNNYDNRSGVVEVTAGDGATIDVENHTGDEIGQNTNVIGAINNSTTTIDIDGSNNQVTATNAAVSTGCLDGSVNIGTSSSTGQQSGGGDATGTAGNIVFSSGSSDCN